MKRTLVLIGVVVCAFVGKGDIAETRKAAEQGYAEAQFNLGCCYDCGNGVAEDKQEAAKWYRKAAEQGYAMAQYNLGNCYYKGERLLMYVRETNA